MQKRDIIKLSITIILIFILLFLVLNLTKRKKKVTFPETEITKQLVSREDKLSCKSLFERLEEETKKLELKRDPFTSLPIIPKERYSSGICLNGILWDRSNPMAIINDSIVKIGDKVDDTFVVDIKQDRVILNDGAREFELRLE